MQPESCRVEFDKPKKGKKSYFLADDKSSGKAVIVEDMTRQDFQMQLPIEEREDPATAPFNPVIEGGPMGCED